MNYKLTIGWLYPELMSTYGDSGNIIVLKKRCEWRGIETEIKKLNINFNSDELTQCDLIFMGGAQDQQQQIVAQDLLKKRKVLTKMIENKIPGLYVCGGYQFLGKYYQNADGTKIPGLNVLNLYTKHLENESSRLIGNVAVRVLNGGIVVGFENHGGRTYLGKDIEPFGKVIKGFGNNGEDKTEGAIYKNSFGTYLHGPILPKNPKFADHLIKLSLKNKYGSSPTVTLSPLDDSLENLTRNAIAKILNIEI
jgi:lipid II isoglutaminyl synthase (glutamine-hydrolysing)